MNQYAIYHIPEAPYAYGVDKETLYVKIRVAKNDVEKVIVHYKDRYDWDRPYSTLEMQHVQGDRLFDYYEAYLNLKDKRFRYIFEITGKDKEVWYLNERGLHTTPPGEMQGFQYPYLCEGDLYHEVSWAQEGIAYQIFPDRFYNGDKSNDPQPLEKWGNEVTFKNFFGGDIKGITEKLDYIKSLGVTFFYMTPIFLSTSNHKYNTKDYYELDPMFGTKEDFKELIEKAHEKGLKVVLDGVFNHSGHDFFAFEDVIKNNEESKYRDWYYIQEYPVDVKNINYTTFWNGIREMPKLRMSQKEAIEYFTEVGRYWIREFDIDGWRLDVCDEIDHVFLKAFYKAIKEEKEEALVIGEIMHSNGSFLKGDEMDTVMNYPFREAVLEFFGKRTIDATTFNNILAIRRSMTMGSMNKQMLNLLDSHDTARFLTDAQEDIRRLILAVAFQYTYVGIPYIYYGDEVGLTGANDPYCRRCMIWEEEKQNQNLLAHFKRMAQIRKENKALVHGNYTCLVNDKGHLVYKRVLEDEEILILINNSQDEHLEFSLESEYKDIYTPDILSKVGCLVIEPMIFKVLKCL